MWRSLPFDGIKQAARILDCVPGVTGFGRTGSKRDPNHGADPVVWGYLLAPIWPLAANLLWVMLLCALIASILDAGGAADEGLYVLVQQWVDRLKDGAPDTTITRALIRRLPAFLGTRTIVLQRQSEAQP